MVQPASNSRLSNFALVARKMIAAIFTVTTVLLPITPALAITPVGPTTKVVTPTSTQGWYSRNTDTGNGGGVDYVTASLAPLGGGALELSTGSNVESISRLRLDLIQPILLSNVTALSYATKQLAAADQKNGNATLRLVLSLDGTASTSDPNFDQLMYEPYYNGFNGNTQNGWQNWDLKAGKFWSNWGYTYNGKGGSGAGGATNFSISDVLANHPSATVTGLVLSMGSYNVSQQVLVDKVVLNDTTYDFEATPAVTAQDFATWDGSASNGFKGLNVGFQTANFSHVDAITVTLQKNGTDIVSNTASPALLADINTGTGGFTQNGQLSSPFVVSGTLDDTYCAGVACWIAGSHKWMHAEKPDSAIITVTQAGVSYVATATNLSEATAAFDNLFTVDATPPTVSDITVANNALWGVGYDIASKPNHRSTATGLPVVGGTIQVGANFSDDTLLSNIIAYLPGKGFFNNSEFNPVPVNNGTWLPIVPGAYAVTWNTKSGADWRAVIDGNYTFSFDARDAGNGQNGPQNDTYKTIALTVDNTPPTVSFADSMPADGAVVRGLVAVDGTFTDANGLMNTDIGVHNDGRTGEGWKCHTDWPSVGGQTCNIDTTQLADGAYKLTMAARDKAGNVTQVFKDIIVKNDAPTTTIASPTAGQVIGGRTLNISGTVSDPNFKYYYCYLTNAAGEVGVRDSQCVTTWALGTPFQSAFSQSATGTTNGQLGSIDLTGLPNGLYTINLVAYDLAGNNNSSNPTQVSFNLANSGPVVIIPPIVESVIAQLNRSGNVLGANILAQVVKSLQANFAPATIDAAAGQTVTDTAGDANGQVQGDATVKPKTPAVHIATTDEPKTESIINSALAWSIIPLLVIMFFVFWSIFGGRSGRRHRRN